MNSRFELFKNQVTNPVKYRLFLLQKLPMGFISGLRIQSLTAGASSVSVRFSWVNKNPFRSVYFAVLSMAAELSTGILAFGQTYQLKPGVSMLVVKMEGEFYKKAIGKIIFTCNQGKEIEEAIAKTRETGEVTSVHCTSIGVNEQGEEVAKFVFSWSYKAKASAQK